MFAHPLNPHLQSADIDSDMVSVSWENYNREIMFFFGNSYTVDFNNYVLSSYVKNPSGIEYQFAIASTDVDLNSRKTREGAYIARIGISKELSGDMLTAPLWKTGIEVSKLKSDLERYKSSKINIQFNSIELNVYLITAYEIFGFVSYGGMKFFYAMDEMKEMRTLVKESSDTSGLSILCGLKYNFTEHLNMGIEVLTLDLEGNSISLSYIF